MDSYERRGFTRGAVVGFDSLRGYDYWLNTAEAADAENKGKLVPFWRVDSVGEPVQIRKRRLQRQIVLRNTDTGEIKTITSGKNLRYSR